MSFIKPPKHVGRLLSKGGRKQWRALNRVAQQLDAHLLIHFAVLCNSLYDYGEIIAEIDRLASTDRFIRDNKNGTMSTAPLRAELLKTSREMDRAMKACKITQGDLAITEKDDEDDPWD